MKHFLYILAAQPHGALYIGRTGNLRQRLDAHRLGLIEETKRAGLETLVWFEACEGYAASAQRERQLKRLRRAEKDRLITAGNPEWRDVSARVPKVEGVRIRRKVEWGLRSKSRAGSETGPAPT